MRSRRTKIIGDRGKSLPQSAPSPSATALPRILMVTDFFHPRIGGVETHVYELSRTLVKRGHFVAVLSASLHPDYKCRAIEFPEAGFTAYYFPAIGVFLQMHFPTIWTSFFVLRDIVQRLRIDIVHAHQTGSTLADECCIHASILGVRSLLTEHSLFELATFGSCHLHPMVHMAYAGSSRALAVSKAVRKNLVDRCDFDPALIEVVYSGLTKETFCPPAELPVGPRKIVTVSRLTARRGIGILCSVIAAVCQAQPEVTFCIIGCGDQMNLLEEVRDKYFLHDRVQLVGPVPHSEVPAMLQQGDIFLNTTLTEGFGIALIEAAACGLRIVTTRVGGIPEVFPPGFAVLSDPNPTTLATAVLRELQRPRADLGERWNRHKQITDLYSWEKNAHHTTRVYREIMSDQPRPSLSRYLRLIIYRKSNAICGAIWMSFLITAVATLNLLWPAADTIHCTQKSSKLDAGDVAVSSASRRQQSTG